MKPVQYQVVASEAHVVSEILLVLQHGLQYFPVVIESLSCLSVLCVTSSLPS